MARFGHVLCQTCPCCHHHQLLLFPREQPPGPCQGLALGCGKENLLLYFGMVLPPCLCLTGRVSLTV